MPALQWLATKGQQAPMDDRTRLNTFLHGIEPRAWVFLHLQCGDPTRAATLFRDTLTTFARESVGEPLARWPMRFWTILLSQPGLVSDPGQSELGESGLARMASGPRIVFLLPMVAGLDETHATEALGVSSHALARALVRARMAWPDVDGHERLRQLLQARIRQPTEADRAAMAALRAEVLGIDVVVPELPPARSRRPAILVVLALLVVLAMVVWALWHASSPTLPQSSQSEPLPLETLPPPPLLDATTLVTHPDYLLLSAPSDAELARDIALLAWFDAEMPAEATTASPSSEQSPMPDAADFAALPEAEQALLASARATWVDLDAATHQRLRAQAADWLRRTPAEQAALRQRVLAWDRLSSAERARQRAPFEVWLALPENDRNLLRRAAQHWSALPAEQQADTRTRFAGLSADAQHLWWLGPTMGRELAPIAARFAFLPADQRDAFLATLRGLDSRGRADFIQLTERMEPLESERLRQELQAQAPTQRNAWLQAKRLTSRPGSPAWSRPGPG